MTWRLVPVAWCLLPAVAAIAALDASALPGESWVGSRYGWTSTPLPGRCKPFRDVCSTEDGGASWHGIFNGGTFVFGVVRTSATSGVVSTGRHASYRFWTRDNGRHWYRTRRIGPEFRGDGPYLFWHSFGRMLYRVRPWPPRGRVLCRGEWVERAFDTVGKRGNICSGPAVEAGMTASVVATLETGTFDGLSNVPGGILATIGDPDSTSPPRILLYRDGAATWLSLPAAGQMKPCGGATHADPIVDWPRITVLGCVGAGPPVGVWISDDGGRSWAALAT